MKRLVTYLCLLVTVMMAASCEHRPLTDLNNGYYIRVYIDDTILNITKGVYAEDIEVPELELPEVMRLTLNDPVTGQIVSERFLQHVGKDEKGYYLDGYIGAEEGRYKIMLYNFGTETTQIRNENNYFNTEAYTNHISTQYYPKLPRVDKDSYAQYDNMNILYEPDHLWALSEDEIEIKPHLGIDTIKASNGEDFRAKSLVETYYIQVKVEGAEWINSSISMLTGVAGGVKIWNAERLGEPPAIVYFEMKQRERTRITVPKKDTEGKDTEEKEQTETAIIYATFNTFGKLPDVDSYFKITFSFNIAGGGNQTETLDITRLFTNDDAINHRWILIDHVIKIKKPEGAGGGGFIPGVDDWDEIEQDIPID